MSGTHTGTVKWFQYDRGYGFITSDIDTVDYFVHIYDIHIDDRHNINRDTRVSFEIAIDRVHEKPKAINVKILKEG